MKVNQDIVEEQFMNLSCLNHLDRKMDNNFLDKLYDLSVTSFTYDESLGKDDRETFGLLAQELAELFNPDVYSMVMKDANGFYMVDYTQMIPLLLALIKRQKKDIDELNQRLLKVEVDILKNN